jgi:hypothetical protein
MFKATTANVADRAKRECRNATDQRAKNASGSLMNDTHLDNPMALLPR